MKPIGIKVPGLKSNIGLGDAVAALTTKLGVKPCGGCKKRQVALNKAVQFKPRLVLPTGYKLRLQGQRDTNVQVVMAECARNFITVLRNGAALTGQRSFLTEAEARADFTKRMAE